MTQLKSNKNLNISPLSTTIPLYTFHTRAELRRFLQNTTNIQTKLESKQSYVWWVH